MCLTLVEENPEQPGLLANLLIKCRDTECFCFVNCDRSITWTVLGHVSSFGWFYVLLWEKEGAEEESIDLEKALI